MKTRCLAGTSFSGGPRSQACKHDRICDCELLLLIGLVSRVGPPALRRAVAETHSWVRFREDVRDSLVFVTSGSGLYRTSRGDAR